MKITIIGAGIVGLSAGWALTKRGCQVTIVEQGAIPNPTSASYDQHRMIRPHYGPQVGYTRMVGEAFEAWDQMWADLGRCHLSETGVLAVDLGDTVWMDATHKSLIETDTAFQRLDATSISKAAPVLSLPETAWGLLAPKADVLFADRILTDLAQWLRNAGAVLLENAQASSINESAAEVTLANGEAIYSDRLVVAAGAWSAELLPDLAEKIVPIRSVVTYV